MPNELPWVKFLTGTYDGHSFKLIDRLPNADSIQNIFLKLICEAGKQNHYGYVFFDDELGQAVVDSASALLKRDLELTRMALTVLSKLKMIEIGPNYILVIKFAEIQNIESLDRIREQTRQRVQRFRERQKAQKLLLSAPSESMQRNSNVTVTHLDKDIDIEEEKEVEEEKEGGILPDALLEGNVKGTGNLENPKGAAEVWQQAKEKLKGEVSGPFFRTWLAGTIGLSHRNGTFVVGVERQEAADFLAKAQRSAVTRALINVLGEPVSVEFVVIDNKDRG